MRKLLGNVGAAVKRADDNFTTSLRAWAARTRDKLDRVSPTPSQLPSHLQDQQRRAGPGEQPTDVEDPAVAEVLRRAQQRPALFQRLDHDFAADGSGKSGLLDPANMLPTRDEEAADIARTAMQARLRAAADDIAAGKPVRVGDVVEMMPSEADGATDDSDAFVQAARGEPLASAPARGVEIVELDASEAAAAQAAVSVRRVRPSRPLTDEDESARSGTTDGAAGEHGNDQEHALTVHDPNPSTLTHWAELHDRAPADFTIESRPDVDSPGARSFAVYEAMQVNPGLLDTSIAIASSPAIRIAAQMAAGYIPPAARGEVMQLPAGVRPDDPLALAAVPALAAAQEALPLAMRLGTGSGSGALPALPGSSSPSTPLLSDGTSTSAAAAGAADPSAAGSAGAPPPAEQANTTDSLAARAAAADALVPANSSIDSLLLAREIKPPVGMMRWGPRPPDASAFDQLVLQPEE